MSLKNKHFFFLTTIGGKMRGGCVSKHRRVKKKNACLYLNLTYLHIFVTGPQVDLHVISYVFHSCAALCLCKCYFLSDIASFSFLPCVFFLLETALKYSNICESLPCLLSINVLHILFLHCHRLLGKSPSKIVY